MSQFTKIPMTGAVLVIIFVGKLSNVSETIETLPKYNPERIVSNPLHLSQWEIGWDYVTGYLYLMFKIYLYLMLKISYHLM